MRNSTGDRKAMGDSFGRHAAGLSSASQLRKRIFRDRTMIVARTILINETWHRSTRSVLVDHILSSLSHVFYAIDHAAARCIASARAAPFFSRTKRAVDHVRIYERALLHRLLQGLPRRG